MIKLILSDLSKTILFLKDESYLGLLNDLHKAKKDEEGYNFWEYYKLDEDYLVFLKSLKNKFKVVLFTSGQIQEYPPLKEKLSDVFVDLLSPEKVGFQKYDFNAYKSIAQMYQIETNEILFIDDDLSFQKAASEAGCHISTSANGINYKIIKSFLGLSDDTADKAN